MATKYHTDRGTLNAQNTKATNIFIDMLDINTTNNLPITPRDFSGINMVTAKNDNKNNNKGDLQIKAMTVMNKYIDIICNLFTFRSFLFHIFVIIL